MSRILCAWSPTWAIANWRRRNPSDSPAEPFALLQTVRGVRQISAVSLEAARLGLRVGQKATDALALVPELVTADAEPERDAEALTALADWCVRFSPAVAVDAPDGLFLDITGVDHLWDGEDALLDDFRTRLAANGLPVRCAIADTAGAAWALVRYAPDATIAPPEGQAARLAPLPPAALRLDLEAAGQIERLGLRRIGQIADLPRAPFGRRFGQAALNRLDQALGRAPEALTFRRPPTPWFARLAFAEPISAPDDMVRVTQDVVAKLCARLETQGHGARRFELCFHRLDGKPLPVAVGLSLPGHDAVRIAKLFAPRLETLDPGFGIEVVTLLAQAVEPISRRQARLDSAREVTLAEGLGPLIDRLTNRLGEDRVWRAVPVESHVPERAIGRARPLGAAPAQARPWNRATPRPTRLFRRPEPVEAVMALTPDDPPTQFRWRGQLHRIRRAEGPERIGEEWWTGDIDELRTDRLRDYYRVEDEAGARFWLFRIGLYGDPERPPSWWLHGLFG